MVNKEQGARNGQLNTYVRLKLVLRFHPETAEVPAIYQKGSAMNRPAFLMMACMVAAAAFLPRSAMADEKVVPNVPLQEIREAAQKACVGGKQYKIAYSHSVSEADFVRQLRRIIDDRAKELGCVTVLHDNTQHNNLEQQINAVQSWITLKVDAIVVLPIDENALKPLQKQAQDQGIKWLTYLGKMKDSNGYVGFDHAQSGQIVANAAVAWVKKNGIKDPKALVTTLSSLPSVSARWTEVERIFGENGIQIVAKQDAAEQSVGLSVTETVLKQHPDINVIVCLNDDAAVGAYRAVKIAGVDESKIFIAGQDGAFEGLKAVNEGGAYRASAAIVMSELGKNVVDLALNSITGLSTSFAVTPTVLASKDDQKTLDGLLGAFKEQ
ncbi:sugar ABC transporter substrate-binding protein [Mesorhizobium sp. CO1-1-8]|uniref:sugar ABC transporter substrate-binding protein n=1 Tax=Mesorhizobium sp. CO1-1-8 TaxID=2876631 RepID=UPI001CD0DBB8|nr:sugar ABC transporter substrate-binding protein [Mesorhizobium sp. CO1-1-8]MBZ9772357.1 sugar ABC transporter substrate-binding protein [Mesorhizobium sp. CO1-1-8]